MELQLRKDGGMAGCIRDTKTCVGMEVRVCTGGGQSRKRAVALAVALAGLDWVLHAEDAGSGLRDTCV